MTKCGQHITYAKECVTCRKAKQEAGRKISNDRIKREVLGR